MKKKLKEKKKHIIIPRICDHDRTTQEANLRNKYTYITTIPATQQHQTILNAGEK